MTAFKGARHLYSGRRRIAVADKDHPVEIQRGMFDKAAEMVAKVETQLDTIGKQAATLLGTVSREMDRGAEGSAMARS